MANTATGTPSQPPATTAVTEATAARHSAEASEPASSPTPAPIAVNPSGRGAASMAWPAALLLAVLILLGTWRLMLSRRRQPRE
jgi:hypothetical protein